MAATFNSFVHPFIIILTVPLAVFGGLVFILFLNSSVNIFSQIALIILIGISTKNSILIVDYTNQIIGKPKGIDIKEKKLTLPLIYAINNTNTKEKKWLINSIKNHNNEKKIINEIIKKVLNIGGLEFSINKIKFFKQKALKILFSFPKNKYRDSLELIIDYIIERKI